jgi:excisionase family DNA binding protein
MPIQTPTLEEFKELKDQMAALTKSPLYLEWVSLNQACKLLGVKTRGTVKRMCNDGRLEYRKDGKLVHINYRSIVAHNTRNQIKK